MQNSYGRHVVTSETREREDLRVDIFGAHQQITSINCEMKSLWLISTDFMCIIVMVLFHKAYMLLMSSAFKNKAHFHKHFSLKMRLKLFFILAEHQTNTCSLLLPASSLHSSA